ncbi:AAA family ATPase [Proteus sp. G2669]|uniref:AAA family ATPase n=1 Tax=Proteus sp. G2669 TaxID=2698881 RepID=UPI001411CDD6|nr:AAA family ATPase [Proteus sp. G2669]NBM56755.1 AAA family ATPase [Proteus sp. G2669]
MKICIMGPSGAGKTTLSKELAIALSLPVYPFDAIYWDMTGDEFHKNSENFITSQVNAIRETDKWVVEGAYDKRLLPFLNDCTVIFRIDISYWKRVNYLIKRLFINRIKRQLPKETLVNTWELLCFSKKYDKRLDAFFNNHSELSSKVIVINDISLCVEIFNKKFKNK